MFINIPIEWQLNKVWTKFENLKESRGNEIGLKVGNEHTHATNNNQIISLAKNSVADNRMIIIEQVQK